MINFREILYSLKREYGVPIDLYIESNSSLNEDTGEVTVNRIKIPIQRAVILPSAMMHDLALLRQANQIFKLSGQMEVDTRQIIIDARDLSVIINLKDYIIYKNCRYNISEINILEKGNRIFGYHLIMKEAKTELLYKINDYIINEKILFSQVITNHSGDMIFDTIDLFDMFLDAYFRLLDESLPLNQQFMINTLHTTEITDSLGLNDSWA